VAALAALRRDAAAACAKADELKRAAAAARDADADAVQRNERLAAACTGALRSLAPPNRASTNTRKYVFFCASVIVAGGAELRNSVSAEADTAATLDAELARLQASLAAQTADANSGGADATSAELSALAAASASARDSAAELEDACAATRMELARLQGEAVRAEQYVHGQVRVSIMREWMR
jgi:hypothetical protein